MHLYRMLYWDSSIRIAVSCIMLFVMLTVGTFALEVGLAHQDTMLLIIAATLYGTTPFICCLAVCMALPTPDDPAIQPVRPPRASRMTRMGSIARLSLGKPVEAQPQEAQPQEGRVSSSGEPRSRLSLGKPPPDVEAQPQEAQPEEEPDAGVFHRAPA